MFFNPAVCDLCKGQFFVLLQTLLAQLPYSHRKQKSLCNHLQSHQNGSYLQIITNVLLICLVVHTAENFLHVFMFPVCRWYRQQGLKAVYFPCATTLFLGYARKSPWMVTILPNCTTWYCCYQNLDILTSTESNVCYKQLLKIFLEGVKCCHFHSVAHKIPLQKSWRQ